MKIHSFGLLVANLYEFVSHSYIFVPPDLAQVTVMFGVGLGVDLHAYIFSRNHTFSYNLHHSFIWNHHLLK